MKKYVIVFLGVILIFGYYGCETSKNTRDINTFREFDIIHNNIENVEILSAKIVSIEPTLNSYKILLRDVNDKEYLVLTNHEIKLEQIENAETSIFYEFELMRLTHKTPKIPDTLSINGQQIVKMPTLNMEDCIYYNDEQFCSSYYQVYKLVNLNKNSSQR